MGTPHHAGVHGQAPAAEERFPIRIRQSFAPNTRGTLFLSRRMVLFVVMMSISISGSLFAQAVSREWLILVYVSGINNRGLDGSAKEVIHLLEKEGSSDAVTVLVKYGLLEMGPNGEVQFPRQLITLILQKNTKDQAINSSVVDSSPHQDMASKTSLSWFASHGIKAYPSKKVMLLFFGKGEGWMGLGEDEISQKKMGIVTLAETLKEIYEKTGKKIDLFVMDADCMQTTEVVYELREWAEIIVGSEEKGPRVGYFYDLVLQEVKADPAMNAEKLANAFVRYADNPVNSAVKTEKLPAFLTLLDKWVDAVTKDPVAMKTAAEEAKKTFSFALKESIDLCEYIERISQALSDQHPAVKAGRELCRFTEEDLLLSYHKTLFSLDAGKVILRPEYDRAKGLAIYLPQLSYDSSMYEQLAFPSNSKWRGFMELLSNEFTQ